MDAAIVAVVVVTALLGYRAGLVAGILGLLGAAAGIALLIAAAPLAADVLAEADPLIRLVVVLTAVVLALGLGESVGGGLAAAIRRRMGSGILSAADQLGGAVLGVAQGVVLVWLVGGLLAAAPSPTLAAEARRSALLREVDARLPSPIGLVAEFGRALQATLPPDVFLEAAPAPAPPVDGPDEGAAERVAAGARASTVRVEAVACGRLMSGTGFSVAEGYFVTNAHVVAGAGSVELSLDGRLERFDATVVRFDPSLDVAVVHAPSLALPALELAEGSPDRGETGAALGHTGGGRLRAIPAAVSRRLDALGRDIYGGGPVARDVVELRADVSPGDSGGPLVLAAGSVGGVIFSESRDDPGIGYALSTESVAPRVVEGVGRTAGVPLGRCIDGP